jgi:adenylate cyclase
MRSATAVEAILATQGTSGATSHLLDTLEIIRQAAGSLPKTVPFEIRARLLSNRFHQHVLVDQSIGVWRRILLGLGAALIIVTMMALGWFSQWDAQVRDILFQPYETSGIVTIVAIDDATLEEFGRLGSWPRSLYAGVVERLNIYGARAVLLDVVFASPTEDDLLLAQTLQEAGNVVMPILGQGDAILDAGYVRYDGTVYPHPELAGSAASLGSSNILHSPVDGYIRELPLITSADEKLYSHIALAALQVYLGTAPDILLPEDDHLAVLGRRIPIGKAGQMSIHYAGPPAADSNGQSPFPIISFSDVLDGELDSSLIRNKLVVVGVMATAEPDRYLTPVSRGRPMFGVEILANAIETIWGEHFIIYPQLWIRILLLLMIGGTTAVVATRPWLSLLFVFLETGGHFLLANLLFERYGVMLSLFYPFLVILLTHIVVTGYRFSVETGERQKILRLFEARVTPEVAHATLRAVKQGEIELGGQIQEITVLFADIRGFSLFTEAHDPEAVMAMVNRYMDLVSEAVFAADGTLASYEGDQAMIIYNAPLSQPDHAWRAVKTALTLRALVGGYHATLPVDHPHRAIDLGYGIYTGRAIVGYAGATRRYDYTALGEPVSIAAQITAHSASGQVLIGESTHNLVSERIKSEKLSPLTVKGNPIPVSVYAVIGALFDAG